MVAGGGTPARGALVARERGVRAREGGRVCFQHGCLTWEKQRGHREGKEGQREK